MWRDPHLPCLHCHPHAYIRMVQNLIERCLLLGMNRDDCVLALEQHAHIQPLITLTVWRELLRENRSFFKAYFKALSLISFPHRAIATQRMSSCRRRKQWRRRITPKCHQ
ncbi:uncharacterized protein [Aristolochia californica]|uniref:uncharacterized protein n=1 Tax=Aristolochia californica TaxID=171875 RepID=UPI0035D5ADF9